MSSKTTEHPGKTGSVSRRSVLKWTAALGGLASISGGGLFYGLKRANSQPKTDEKTVWTTCNVNCGSRCLLRAHVTDGVVTRIETDNYGDEEYGLHEIRACLRGRSMRHRLYAPGRLKYPMKRVASAAKASSNAFPGTRRWTKSPNA
ncbi:hypothetical protein ACR42D_07125 [Desulfovibrio caledoniensis]